MDIVTRLKLFLKNSGIANSQFADNCDIPRPTLSQLLNGRNKKVSDEVIAKIHRAYPSLNIMWLMFGDGEMFVPNANNDVDGLMTQSPENAFSPNNASTTTGSKTIDFGAADDNFTSQRVQSKPSAHGRNPMVDALQRVATMNQVSAGSRKGGDRDAADSRVVSIMVLYSDGRFETFLPQ